jgi:YbbR domain-containing protein
MLDVLASNWPLKLLALALAFAIWVSVTGESRVVQDFRVPLELELDDDFVVASSPPTTIEVRLRGVESLMRRLDPVRMVMRLDLRDAGEGEQELVLARENLSGIPRGVEVEFIDPNRSQVVLAERKRLDLRVEPTFLGQPEDGYAFYNAQVTPEKLRVEGPAAQVENLELLRTNPIRLDGRSEPFVARVGVVPEGELVRVLGRETLEVYVVVDAAAVERRIENIPVEVVGAAAGTQVNPETLNLILSGPPRLLDQLTPDQIRLVADVSRLSQDATRADVPVIVDFPGIPEDERSRVSVKSMSRRQVEVSLSGRRSL